MTARPWRQLLLWAMLGALGLAALAAVALELGQRASRPQADPPELQLAEPEATAEFARALEPQLLQFPADHGPHLEYQTEWWYFIGNLQAEDGRHFGFQLTFFRRGLQPGEPDRPSAFGANHIYSAHLALTDTAAGQHRAWERFSRGAAGLAGAQAQPFRVWLDDWSAQGLDAAAEVLHLSAGEQDLELDLLLRAVRPPILHGDQGLSRKGAAPGNASYYVSIPRMVAEGRLQVEGVTYQVAGLGWFDHEWGTAVLGRVAVGWDWFGLQLDDGRELMLFQVRNRERGIEPASEGTLVRADGATQRLPASEVRVEALGGWVSPASGTVYPSGWRIELPGEGLELFVQPRLEAQENNLSLVYWEGAVLVSGSGLDGPLGGWGYVELTGYHQPLEGDF